MRIVPGIWVVATLLLVGCAGMNRVSGTVAGKSWDGVVKQAEHCDDCSGGPRVQVVFQRENELGTMILELDDCSAGATARFGSGARLSWFEHPNGRRIEATKGEVDVQQCTPTELDASFRAELSDGGSVSGRLSTALQ
jgi:hypothetical protein